MVVLQSLSEGGDGLPRFFTHQTQRLGSLIANPAIRILERISERSNGEIFGRANATEGTHDIPP